MINPNFNINKVFRKQVEKCMKTKFCDIIQPFIRATLLKNKTRMLALLTFFKTRAEKISYRVLSFVIYTIIKNYVCIGLSGLSIKKLGEIPLGYGEGPNI